MLRKVTGLTDVIRSCKTQNCQFF